MMVQHTENPRHFTLKMTEHPQFGWGLIEVIERPPEQVEKLGFGMVRLDCTL